MAITGEEKPYKTGYAVTDVITGLSLYGSINAALIAWLKDNKGMFLDSSLLGSTLFSMAYVPFSYLNSSF